MYATFIDLFVHQLIIIFRTNLACEDVMKEGMEGGQEEVGGEYSK